MQVQFGVEVPRDPNALLQDPERLQFIARLARTMLETTGQVTNDMLAAYYEQYVPNQLLGLERFLNQVRAKFPSDNCHPATVLLRHMYGCGRIENGEYRGPEGDRYHTYLDLGATVFGPDTIADITADQFGGPAVYVGPRTQRWVPGWYEPEAQAIAATH